MAEKKKILIVDDNAAFIELAKSIFAADFELETSSSGFEGLGKALTFLPGLILLDVNMPGITGVEFARKLSANPATANIPIIVITASDYNSLTQSLLHNEHNVKLFMTKLLPVETIRERALAVLNKNIR